MKMPKIINVGKEPDDGTGDVVASAGLKISNNLEEIIKFLYPNYHLEVVDKDDLHIRNQFIIVNQRFLELYDLLDME